MLHDRRSNPVYILPWILFSRRPAPSGISIQHHPAAASIISPEQLALFPTPNCYLALFAANTSSMFSITSSLFFQPFSTPILCSQHIPASFHQNRG